MLRCLLLRLALPTLAIAGFVANTPAGQTAQPQDSQSVADAARRAREDKKKAAAKPAKVITDDDVKPAAAGASGATAAPAAVPSSADAAKAQSPAGTSGAASPEEIAALKEQIKHAQSDLDLLQREKGLQQDTYYSNPDYAHDTAGKAKLDGMKQQIADKQAALDDLKAKLAELGGTMDNPASAPGKPATPGSAPPKS